MPMRLLAVCVLSLSVLSAAACQAAAPAGLSDADKAALRQNDQEFATAANAKDFGRCASMYLDDASVLAPNGAAVQGREQIQKFLSGFPPISDFKVDVVDLDGRGDLAYVRGNYTMTVSPANAPVIHDRGKYVEIWRKQADGSWKIKWDIFNSDVPPAAQ